MTVYYGPMRGATIIKEYPINDANKKLAVRFTARSSKTVNKLHLCMKSVSNPPTYRIGLQEDVRGLPSGTWLAYGDFTPVQGYNSVALNKDVTLDESYHYHLVIEHKSGTIDATHYCQPYVDNQSPHYLYPDAFEDSDYRCLWSTDGGLSWSSLDYDVGWFLEYTDGTAYGQPHSENWVAKFQGDVWIAERIKPNSRRIVSSVEVNIIRIGNPPNDLDLVVYNVTDGLEEVSTTIPVGDVPPSHAWVEVLFPSPITLLPTKTYKLILKTVGGDSDNCYGWRYDMAYNAPINLTWGGADSCYQHSFDGGINWDSYPQIDCLFRFIVKLNPALKTAPNSGF